MRLSRVTMRLRANWAAAACVGLALVIPTSVFFWFHFQRCGSTFYSAGFTEAGFASLRQGMRPDQVEAVMGPPLEKHPQTDGGTLWTYSNRDDDTCDFEMRWVYFRAGRVEHVVNMHWDD
jgi:hypothetical protein